MSRPANPSPSRPSRAFRHAPAAFVALAVAAGAAALLRGGGTLYAGALDSDLTNSFHPARAFAYRWLSRGVMPDWDPHSFCGVPVTELWQSALHSPVSLACTALLEPGFGIQLQTALHLALAAAGAWALARLGLRAGRWPAALCALAWAFGGVFTARVAAGHVTVVTAMAWWPWAMLGALRGSLDGALAPPGRWFAAPVRRWWLLSAVATAHTVLAGAPQYVVYLFSMQAVAVWAAAGVPRTRAGWARAAAPFAGSWALAMALSAPQWGPALTYLPFSGRAGGPAGAGSAPSLTAIRWDEAWTLLAELVWPLPLGDDTRQMHVQLKSVWETATWSGTAPLALTVGVLAGGRWRRGALSERPPRSAGAVGARLTLGLTLLTAHTLAGLWLPGAGGFREASKGRVIFAMAMAIGAATGAGALAALMRNSRMRAARRQAAAWRAPAVAFAAALGVVSVALAGALTFLPARAGAWLYATAGLPYDPRAAALLLSAADRPVLLTHWPAASLAGAAAGCTVFCLAARGLAFPGARRRRAAFAALAVFAAAELAIAHGPLLLARHAYADRAMPAHLEKRLRAELALREPDEVTWRVAFPPDLMNRAHLIEGAEDTGGYDPLMPYGANNRTALVGSFIIGQPDGTSVTLATAARILNLRRFANGRRLDWLTHDFRRPRRSPLVRAPRPRSGQPTPVSAWLTDRVKAGAPNPAVYGPRADGVSFVVTPERAGLETPAEALPAEFRRQVADIGGGWGGTEISGDISPGFEALPPGTYVPPPHYFPPVSSDVTQLDAKSPNRLVYWVRPTSTEMLNVRTTWLPGWQVSIDRGPWHPALCADHWCLAAIVPPSTHRVEFAYRPVRLIPAYLAVAAGVAACALAWRTRRPKD